MRVNSIRTGLLATLLAAVAAGEPGSAALQRSVGWPAVKQWTADVIVTADCDRSAFDGSRTIIHNRIQTTYAFTQRIEDTPSPGRGQSGPPMVKWSGRATTTYKWAVGTQFRDSIDIEEGSGSFDTGAALEMTDATRISIGRPPARPFTRKKYAGTSLLETSTADDVPPAAELYEAPLPSDVGTMSGDRKEFAYWLLGGVVLNCDARRQWTMRAP